MRIQEAAAKIEEERVVGIIRLDDLTNAVEISAALLRGGIGVQEFTLSNPAAFSALKKVRSEIHEFSDGSCLLGIGSIRTLEQAKEAIACNVHFVVTPIFVPEVVVACVEASVPVLCGALTPTEIAQATKAGATMVKVFPARTFGPNYIQDLLAPMPELSLVPTGGVNLENMADYFAAGAKAVGIGGNLVASDRVQAQDWEAIEIGAAKYVEAAKREAN
ncbi:MAG: bifunctional 4-hydroxy-2-oxoglutarate aldolase/2-dehydro-3-deoxy-phosphogluconate aldolase [Planctomycetota bacterium]